MMSGLRGDGDQCVPLPVLSALTPDTGQLTPGVQTPNSGDLQQAGPAGEYADKMQTKLAETAGKRSEAAT